MATEVAWVSPYPAHYSRTFHRELEARWPGTFYFVYVVRRGRSTGRSYEVGGVPEESTVVRERSALAELRRMNRVLEQVDPRVLILNGHSPAGLAFAAVWGLLNGRRVAYRSDTNLMDLFRKSSAVRRGFHRLLGHTLLRSMDVLLYVGSQNRCYYRWATGLPDSEQRWLRIPYPHDMAPSSAAFGGDEPGGQDPDEPFTFLYLGRLASEKSVRSLISAGSRLLETAPRDWRILIAGDGPEREELERLTENHGLGDRVTFLGEVNSDARAEIYGSADVFVLPSDREPWGLVVNEALTAGLPVVAPYWVGAVDDLVVDGYNGVVLDTNARKELARAMNRLLDDPSRAQEIGRRGPNIIASGGWNLEGSLSQMVELLDILR